MAVVGSYPANIGWFLLLKIENVLVQVAVIVGGMSVQKQERILNQGPEIVVATPGRLWDLIQTGNPHLATVADIK